MTPSPIFDNAPGRVSGTFNGWPLRQVQGRDLLPGMVHPGWPERTMIVSISDAGERVMSDGHRDEIQLDAWYSIVPEGADDSPELAAARNPVVTLY